MNALHFVRSPADGLSLVCLLRIELLGTVVRKS